MDNVVQNISITDIIPGKSKPSLEEQQKISELANLIKQFGMLEPILVRPKDGKYEIIMGMEKYEAALLAKLTTIPVIIKEVEDEVYSKYKNVDNIQDISMIDQTKGTFSKREDQTDIINLDELSKIKLEYERDDVKMNNGQYNNNVNNNFGVPSGQNPAFGGSFFPSLEDEPTNMNMMSGITAPLPTTTPGVSIGNDINTNLIDLTDLSLEKDSSNIAMPPLENKPVNPEPAKLDAGFEIPNFGVKNEEPSAPAQDNIINIENLQNNNQAYNPIKEPVSMDILNADFGPPPMDNKFNMAPPIQPNNMPSTPSSGPMMGIPPIQNPMQPNYGIPPQGMPMMGPAPMPGIDMGMMPPMQANFPPNNAPSLLTRPDTPSIKNATLVINTIKNLAMNLAAFGYKININEESTSNGAKIIIDVENN